MLYPEIDRPRRITEIRCDIGSLFFESEKYIHLITPPSPHCIRLSCSCTQERTENSTFTTTPETAMAMTR